MATAQGISTEAPAVKERPILFSAPMVRAILEGRKTQTRRIVKPQPRLEGETWYKSTPSGSRSLWISTVDTIEKTETNRPATFNEAFDHLWECPYGQSGDRLWVRETWMPFDHDHRPPNFAYRAEVTSDGDEIRRDYIKSGRDYRWRPSIHMPRKASRITLEITSIRVELLNDISEEDAKAEGATPDGFGNASFQVKPDGKATPYKRGFCSLWESINGADSWASNPWVWVVSFKRLEPANA